MVVDKAIQYGTGWYFQCKNTYKDNPQVFVGHVIPFLPVSFPYDAIIISFDRTYWMSSYVQVVAYSFALILILNQPSNQNRVQV